MSIDALAVSRVVGITTQFKDYGAGRVRFLPMRIALIGQGKSGETYSTEKYQATNAVDVGNRYGFGSPLHLAAMMLFPRTGDGVGSIPVTIYPLEDDSSGVVADGAIGAVGVQTETESYKIKISNIEANVTITEGDTADEALAKIRTAILGILEMPVVPGVVGAGSLPLVSKWAGLSANDIYVEIEGDEAGIVFTITQLTGGLVNPDIQSALDEIGTVWETLIINCLNYDDTDALDALQEFGDTRWGPLEKKPFIAFCSSDEDYATRTVVTDARTDDKINALISCPGCHNLPAQMTARAVAKIAITAQNNPAQNYASKLNGLTPGSDAVQEDYATRDLAVKAGSGTTIITDNKIEMNDTVTMYHPEGEEPPAFRYVVDIIKLMNIVYNNRLIFEAEEWKGAPLLPDDTATNNATAKKPKDFKTALGNLAYNLGLEAIISDPTFTKENLTAEIDSTNPKRVNWVFPVKLSGNVEIIDGTINFGFYFG